MTLNEAKAKQRLSPAAACLALVLVSVIGHCQSTVGPQFFGMHVHQPADLSTLNISIVPYDGYQINVPVPVGTIRLWDDGTDWNSLCLNWPSCNFSNLDPYLNYAAAHGLEVIYTFGRVPKSENPNGPTCNQQWATNVANISDWNAFVTNLVNYANGRIKYWEVWNEPNDNCFWSGTNSWLVALAQSAYQIIKNASPSSEVLLPSTYDTNASWIDSFLSAGGGAYADILTFHGYTGPQPEDYIGFVSRFQMVFAKHNLSGYPVWDTETNWHEGGQAYVNNPAEDAAWVARSQTIEASMGVSRSMWYGWDFSCPPSCYANLWNPGSGITEAGIGYANFAQWVTGATISACQNPISSSVCQSGVSSTAWSCSLSRSNGYAALILWDTGTGTSCQVGSQYIQFRDLITNQIQSISSSQTVTLGHQPILVESGPTF